ncbi:putative DNA-binding protein [Paenibacillus hunanensis]|uniref:putative DNA-binding protein n=1 Tax=Paenibacillus hunanensis TaxID=539262 RepID=UPI002A6A3142|nr:putative DNA-binding protein [Paenibacillus hunanensis]WPP39890.1 putative DNA-binding protein [Paenibacillus hunanensis]
MSQENRLEKTTRINLLFDFYEPLLTDKQQMFLKYYFHDDYSLGEIAAEFSISRQAVYEHIKRAEQVLEMYEEKLGLMDKHYRRSRELDKLKQQMQESDLNDKQAGAVMNVIEQLEAIDRMD